MLDQLYGRIETLGSALKPTFEIRGSLEQFHSAGDFVETMADNFGFVVEGMLKLECDGKMVRLFTDNSIVHGIPDASTLTAEFMTTVLICHPDELIDAGNPFALNWSLYRALEVKLLHGLIALHSNSNHDLSFEMTKFEAGEDMITQGDEATYIFVLLSGEAEVHYQGAIVGSVGPNEFFGEGAVLAGNHRRATVRATSACLVQRVRGAEFVDFLAARPTIALDLIRTQAKRIDALNGRVAA